MTTIYTFDDNWAIPPTAEANIRALFDGQTPGGGGDAPVLDVEWVGNVCYINGVPSPPIELGTGGSSAGRTLTLSSYCKGDGSDESVQLQAAMDDATTSGRLLVCDVPGEIGTSKTIIVGDQRVNSDQWTITRMSGHLRVTALGSMTAVMRMSTTVTCTDLDLEINAASKAFIGLYLKDYGRSSFGRIHVTRALTSGVFSEPDEERNAAGALDNNNVFSIEKLRVTFSSARHSSTAKVSGTANGSSWYVADGGAACTVWELTTPLPAHLCHNKWAAHAVLMGDGRWMQIRQVVDSTHIEVFNENRPVGTTDSITVVSAAFAFPFYGDHGCFYVGSADIRNNGGSTIQYGGYGGHIAMLTQQANWAGTFIDTRASFSVGYCYTEAVEKGWLVVRDVNRSSISYGATLNAAPDNWQGINQTNTTFMNLAGRNKLPSHWIMTRDGQPPVDLSSASEAPYASIKVQPGTEQVRVGVPTAFRKTSGSHAIRIDNDFTDRVGEVELLGPSSGPTTANFSLLRTGLGHVFDDGNTTLTLTIPAGGACVKFWADTHGGETTWHVKQLNFDA